MRRLLIALLIVSAGAVLTGCGNKGPLVRAPAARPVPATAPAPAASVPMPAGDGTTPR
ncbi:MAG TPA: lipoprotein [Rhodanobacteraceae bacterium]|jgi:predicted small lipoprotein YifL|nr:lipoprotein [Rhodanobacteraceae bacterium]